MGLSQDMPSNFYIPQVTKPYVNAPLELYLAFISLGLTILLTALILLMFKELSIGIFSGFFKLLIVAAAVSIVGRLLVLLQIDGRLGGLPAGIDLLTATLFFIILTLAFARLVRDWRRVSLTHPMRRGQS